MINKYNILDGIKTGAVCLVGAAILGGAVLFGEYADVSGPSKYEMGRTKNSIAAVVAGIAGQKMHGNSQINLEVKKHLFPSSQITGHTTPASIDTYMDLNMSHVNFKASNNAQGQLEGEVDKSEFDWGVKQQAPNAYHIKRFGPKFDSELNLNVADGRINGTYVRHGPHFDWDVKGTYDKDGNVSIEIDGPVNLGVTLEGKITKR